MTTAITATNEVTETFTEIEFAFDYNSVGVAFTLPGTPEDVYKELIRLGLDEDTNYTCEAGFHVGTNSLLLAFPSEDVLNAEAGWLAHLRGEEASTTRLSVFTEKIAAANGEYPDELIETIRGYIDNFTEAEQLVAVASIDDAVSFGPLLSGLPSKALRTPPGILFRSLRTKHYNLRADLHLHALPSCLHRWTWWQCRVHSSRQKEVRFPSRRRCPGLPEPGPTTQKCGCSA